MTALHGKWSGLRVNIVCSSRELFGADRCALRAAEALRVLGAEPRLILPAQRPDRGLEALASKRAIPWTLARIPLVGSHGLEGLFGRKYGTPDADLVIANTTAVVGATRGSRSVMMVREWLEPRSMRHRALSHYHAARVDAVCGVSRDVLHQWTRCADGPQRRVVINDWLDEDVIEHESEAVDGSKADRSGHILCLGRFNQWKGQEVLAAAYEAAFASMRERPHLRFLGAQPGTPFEDRANAIAERGTALNWSVEEFTPDPWQALREAALLVVPSLHPEPFGMVILEALAAGCRVLAFPGGGPTDIAPDFPGALQVVARSADALAEGLSEWWGFGGPAQSEEERRSTLETLGIRWSARHAVGEWDSLIAQLFDAEVADTATPSRLAPS